MAAGVKSNQAANERRKKQGIINEQAAFDEGIFNKNYYSDITRRSDIQNLLRLQDDKLRLADARATAQSAIMGATPEQQLAQHEANRRSYADAVADIASNASQLRDQYLRDFQGQRSRYYAQRLGMQDELSNISQNESNQWSTTGNNAFSVGTNLLAGGVEDIMKK